MTRRLLATIGLVVLLALAMTLLWRVYVHHTRAEPYERDEPVIVSLPSQAA
jgi:hypothetical protein